MKHTPGPWEAVKEQQWGWCVKCGSSYIVLRVTEANARLIAAAPELLEALKAAREEIEILWKETGRNPTSPAARPWESVIAKAEGKDAGRSAGN